ncbi:MAG: hypothetical protein IIA61_03880 [Candidatus Marinimicrobia bacterium]|nr:hypothetical protein [Candidatus Neomarinimicrobiota bacterium]
MYISNKSITSNKTLLITLATFLSVNLYAQESDDSFPDIKPINTIEIYRSAHETAIQDGEINKNEEAILNTLQTSLNLSNEEIASLIGVLLPEQPIRLDQSGRWPLVLQNMVYAGGIYGWMIPYVLDVKDFKWYIGSEMMSLGFSYYLTYKYTKNMVIPHARAQMMRAGSAVGLVYGRGINNLLGLGFDLFEENSGDSKLGALILMASIPAGIYVGDKLYQRLDPSHGQAWSLTLWGEIGSWTMRALHLILESEPKKSYKWEYERYEEGEWYIDEEAYNRDRKKHKNWVKKHRVFDMAGYPLGIYTARRFFKDRQYTFGDAFMLMQGRSLGWLYAIMIGDILDLEFEDTGGRLLRMGGTIGGTLLTDRFIKSRDYTFGQSVLNLLGIGSGIAFAAGLAIIMEVDDFKPVEVMMMTGGIAGLYLSNSILEVKSESGFSSNTNKPSFSIVPSFRVLPKVQKQRNKLTLAPMITINVNF